MEGRAVRVPDYEFLVTETGAAEAAWAAMGPRYTVAAGGRQRQVRVWLDTFDARLRAAGLSLAHVSGARRRGQTGEAGQTGPAGQPGELVLTCRDGVTRQPAAPRWPALIEALPEGPVTERLRPVIGVRALLPLATVRADVGEWRILNADEKTVVRAYLDRAQPAGGATALPARMRLVPVRGYDDQAARLARMLAGVVGLCPQATAELDLLRAGHDGPEAPDTSLHPGQDARAALAGMLLALWHVVEANVPGVVGDIDTEFLHDLRVAVRRTRSVLKLAGDVLPGGVAARFAPEFKWLGDLTTPMRDLDVLLLDFPGMLAGLAEADPDDLAPLRDHLRRQRSVQRRALLRGLRSPRFAGLAEEWRDALTPLTPGGTRRRARRGAAAVDTATLAAERIARAWRRVDRRARTTAAGSPPAVLHDLRKRCKELRYVLELFAGVCQPRPHRALVKDLKEVQDSLGEFQDAEVHRDAIRGYAVAMLAAQRAGAHTLLAMGELVAGYGARQRQGAAEAVARVGRLVSDANHRRVSELVTHA